MTTQGASSGDVTPSYPVVTTPVNGSGEDICLGPADHVIGCTTFVNDANMSHHTCFMKRLYLHIPIWIYSICSLYISVMLILDAARNRNVSKQVNKKRERYAAYLKSSRVFAACFTTCMMIYSGISMFLEESGNVHCEIFGRCENALYWLTISVIYCVLWIRQRVIYNQRGLQSVTSPVTSFLSYATIFMVIILPIVNLTLFSTYVSYCYRYDFRICVINGISGSIWASEFVVPILLPLTLLVLFSWPLLRHHKNVSKSARGQKSVVTVLRRIAIATGACLATDLIAITCNKSCYLIVAYVLRRTSIFANLISMMMSFADWMAILFPICVKKKPADGLESSRTPTISAVETTKINGNLNQI